MSLKQRVTGTQQTPPHRSKEAKEERNVTSPLRWMTRIMEAKGENSANSQPPSPIRVTSMRNSQTMATMMKDMPMKLRSRKFKILMTKKRNNKKPILLNKFIIQELLHLKVMVKLKKTINLLVIVFLWMRTINSCITKVLN